MKNQMPSLDNDHTRGVVKRCMNSFRSIISRGSLRCCVCVIPKLAGGISCSVTPVRKPWKSFTIVCMIRERNLSIYYSQTTVSYGLPKAPGLR